MTKMKQTTTTVQEPHEQTPEQEFIEDLFWREAFPDDFAPTDQMLKEFVLSNPELADEVIERHLAATFGSNWKEKDYHAGGGYDFSPEEVKGYYISDVLQNWTGLKKLAGGAREYLEDEYNKYAGRKSFKERLFEDVAHRKDAEERALNALKGLNRDLLQTGTLGYDRLNIANRKAADELRQAGLDLINKNRGITNEAIGGRRSALDQYLQGVNPLLNTLRPRAISDTPVNIKFGDFSMPFITGSQRYAQNQFADLLGKRQQQQADFTGFSKDAQEALAQLIFGTLANQSQVDRDVAEAKQGYDMYMANLGRDLGLGEMDYRSQIDKTYSPNMAENAFMNWLQGIKERNEQLNYSLPDITATTKAWMQNSVLGDIAKATGIIKNLAGAFSDIKGTGK